MEAINDLLTSQDIKNIWHNEATLKAIKATIKRLEKQEEQMAKSGNEWEHCRESRQNLIAMLYRTCDELYHELAVANELIEAVENKLVRDILRTRYVCNMSVRQTAKMYHYSNRRIMQLQQEGLAEIEKRLGGNTKKC